MKRILKTIVVIILVIVIFTYLYKLVENNSEVGKKERAKKVVESYTYDKSSVDADNDGIDDYLDIMKGAKEYIKTKPKYESKYYNGGYPNDGYGVCTDVIWQAFKSAGYDLKSLVDNDIANNLEVYNISAPDPNIDFRRVQNLKIFFDRNAESLTTSLDNPNDWQLGDIVVFKDHIGICSNKLNKEGIPLLIHHNQYGAKESNCLVKAEIIGHYRWKR